MNSENVGLSRDHRIKWIVHMIQCSGKEYDFIVARLNQLPYANLMRLDAVASSGYSQGESLAKELLTEDDISLILTACDLSRKHDHHHGISDIKEIVSALKQQGYDYSNVEVHLNARSSYSRATKPNNSTKYSENLDIVTLVEENPQRMQDIMDFITERKTDDPDLIRAYLSGAVPLSEGTL